FANSHGAHRGPPPFPTRRSSDLGVGGQRGPKGGGDLVRARLLRRTRRRAGAADPRRGAGLPESLAAGLVAHRDLADPAVLVRQQDRKSTRLNSSHVKISYAVFCL